MSGSSGKNARDGEYDHSQDTYARRLIRHTRWAIDIVDDPMPWALSFSTGQIVIHTGLFDLMDTNSQGLASSSGSETRGAGAGADDRIAAVIAHEVAHILCEHHRERLSDASLLVLVLSWIAAVCSPVALLFPDVAAAFLTMPNSRIHEREADALALKLMARACFNPTEAVRAEQLLYVSERRLNNMVLSGKTTYDGKEVVHEGTLLSTHPCQAERIRTAQESLPAALEIRKKSGCSDLETLRSFRLAASTAAETAGSSATADSTTAEPVSTTSSEQARTPFAQENSLPEPPMDSVVTRDVSSQSPPAPSP